MTGKLNPSVNRIVITEDDDTDIVNLLISDAVSYVCPRPSVAGDYLTAVSSVPRVPSKSILKRTSSYGSLPSVAASSSSKSCLCTCLSGSGRGGPALTVASEEEEEEEESLGVGWDLDDDDNSSSRRSQQRGDAPSYLPTFLDCGAPDAAGGPAPSSSTAVIAETDEKRLESSLNVSDNGGGSSMRRNNVSFHSVDVREYDRTIGDNPSCRSGPPISLDWSYSQKSAPVPLEEYECERCLERAKNLRHIHLNKFKRRQILSFQWGHSEEEMKLARKDTKRAQQRRTVTNHLRPVHIICDALHSWISSRKEKKSVSRIPSSKKKKESVRGDNGRDLTDSSSTKPSSIVPAQAPQ